MWRGEVKTYRDGKVPGFLISVNETCKSYKFHANLWQDAIGRRKSIRTVRHTIARRKPTPCPTREITLLRSQGKIKRGVAPFPQKNKRRGTHPNVNGGPVGWAVDELMLSYAEVLEHNPVRCVVFHKDRSSNRVIARTELFDWLGKTPGYSQPTPSGNASAKSAFRSPARERYVHSARLGRSGKQCD